MELVVEEDHLGQVRAVTEGPGSYCGQRGLHKDYVCGVRRDVRRDGSQLLIRAEHLVAEAITAHRAGLGRPGQEQEGDPAQQGSREHLLDPRRREQKGHLYQRQHGTAPRALIAIPMAGSGRQLD
jgi:hypothetical protein